MSLGILFSVLLMKHRSRETFSASQKFKLLRVQWLAPVVPAIQETEVTELLETRCSRPAWTT